MTQLAASAEANLQDAVAERLDNLKSWKVRWWAPFVLGMMMMGDSWDVGVIGYVMPSMRQEWMLSSIEAGALISAGFAGQALGAVLFGPLAEKFGRLYILNLTVVLMCVTSIACAFAHTPTEFFWLRFAQGVGFGGAVPVCVSYVNELAPTATRGRYFSLFQFLLVAGFAVCGFVAAAVIPHWGWRAMFIIGAFPILFVPLILFTMPESPRWLARFGKARRANHALVKLGAVPVDEGLSIGAVEEAPKVPIKALAQRNFRWLTISTCALWFLTSVISYGFSTWTPTLFVDEFGLKLEVALEYSALTGIAYMLTPLVFAVILDKVGRRPTGIAISAMTLAVVIVLALLGTAGGGFSILLMLLAWVTAGSCFVLLWPYTAEIFPTEMRSTALGLSSAAARGGATVTPLIVAGVLGSTKSINAVFGILCVATLAVLLLWIFTSKEMAGRRLDQPT